MHVEHYGEDLSRVKHVVEQVNVFENAHEDVQLFPFSYQQGNEGPKDHVESS